MSTPLFSPSIIPTSISLPEGYILRPLQKSDHTGFLEVLRVLTTVGDISLETWTSQYDWMASRNDEYFVIVVEEEKKKKVVAVGSLIVEKKLFLPHHHHHHHNYYHLLHPPCSFFLANRGWGVGGSIRNCGNVGHIEDIAVASDQQGKKLGLKIIQALDGIAEKVGCYKSILDCSEKNQVFYEKCGFKVAGIQMAHYYEK